MRIGIITYHRPINYGAVLQAVALNKKLNMLGADSVIVDYRNDKQETSILNSYFFKTRGLKNKIKSLLFGKNKRIKEKNFRKFLNDNCILSKEYNKNTINQSNNEFDLFVTGSDQVWNLKLNDEDYNYFLSFVDDDNKKISISSSFGYSQVPEEYVSSTAKYLSKYKYISVREKKGAKIIEELIERKADVLLDPTLLLNRSEWLKLASPVKFKIPKEYILFYAVSPTEEDIEMARRASLKYNLDVVLINYNMRYIKGMINCFNLGPDEFLWLFANAKLIVTNSFHGTAFSINLNKDFFVRLSTKANNGNSRIENIIDIVGLQDRYVENLDSSKEIDWNIVNKKLEKERQKSINKIKKYINME